MGSSLFNFSRRATRDADIMEIQKYHGRTNGPTDGRTGVGARDTCVSKNLDFHRQNSELGRFIMQYRYQIGTGNFSDFWWYQTNLVLEKVSEPILLKIGTGNIWY